MRKKFPAEGREAAELLQQMKTMKSEDLNWKKGRSMSYVYFAEQQVTENLKKAYLTYFSENALNPSAFPSLRKMEGEVVGMCLGLFGGGVESVGSLTSGGTESILLAVKAAKGYAKKKYPAITHPEIIFPISAHPAFNKACDYFDVKPVIIPIGKDYRVDSESYKKSINQNTILLVASAPSYPQGVVDPIEAIGEIALSHNLLFHVDSCIGGFVLPFLAAEKRTRFDLAVPGVSSLSADIHKYGFASKGSSVLLYNNPEIRKSQFYVYTDWPGGMYGSPTIAGTRPGGAIAVAWMALKMIGRNGYEKYVHESMETALKYRTLIDSIPGLQVLGEPDLCIFSFASDEFDIYELGDEMHVKGWLMDRQQHPSCIHISISPNHQHYFEEFKTDLLDAVAKIKKINVAHIKKEIQVGAMKGLKKLLPENTFNKIKNYAIQKGGVENKRSAAMYGMIGDLDGDGEVEDLVRRFLDQLMR